MATTPRKLISEIVERHSLDSVIHTERDRQHLKQYSVGHVILNLSEEKREVLKQLKSDDVKDLRHPFLGGYYSKN